jgi:hypothetical protein
MVLVSVLVLLLLLLLLLLDTYKHTMWYATVQVKPDRSAARNMANRIWWRSRVHDTPAVSTRLRQHNRVIMAKGQQCETVKYRRSKCRSVQTETNCYSVVWCQGLATRTSPTAQCSVMEPITSLYRHQEKASRHGDVGCHRIAWHCQPHVANASHASEGVKPSLIQHGHVTMLLPSGRPPQERRSAVP